MSTILIILVGLLIFGFVVYNRMKEDKEWISVMVTTENRRDRINEKYVCLKSNNVNCRIKSVGSRGTDQSLHRSAINVREIQSISLEVYYKDLEKAQQLLNT